MILQNEKIRSEKLYRVGYLPSINKYVMACVVPWISWYDRYFEISEAEYNSFGLEDLDKLATEYDVQLSQDTSDKGMKP